MSLVLLDLGGSEETPEDTPEDTPDEPPEGTGDGLFDLSGRTADLVFKIRLALQDTVEPFQLPDQLILEALSDAQDLFADRTLCVTRSGLACAVTADNPWVALPARTLKPRAVYAAHGRPLHLCTVSALVPTHTVNDYGLQTIEDWRTLRGTPRYALSDLRPGALRLVPIPEQDGTVLVDTFALPQRLFPSNGVQPVPEIPEPWPTELIDGALAKLFRLKDEDFYNPKLADIHALRWEVTLNIAAGSIERNRRGPGVVGFNRASVW